MTSPDLQVYGPSPAGGREQVPAAIVHRITGSLLMAYALIAMPAAVWIGDAQGSRVWPLVAVTILYAGWVLFLPAPKIHSVANHVRLAGTYLVGAVSMWALEPHGVAAVATFITTPSLLSLRLDSLRALAWHVSLACAALLTVAIFSNDTSIHLAVLIAISAVAGIALVNTIVLDTAGTRRAELERLVRVDPLTGAGNRRLLDERLAQELSRSERTGRPLSVIVLDLNGFKLVNDAYGHDAGDYVLTQVSTVLMANVRPHDVVTRQGGDEFCVVLPDTSNDQALAISESLRHAVADLVGEVGEITTGVGVATRPSDGHTAEELLRVADAALRHNKQREGEPSGR